MAVIPDVFNRFERCIIPILIIILGFFTHPIFCQVPDAVFEDFLESEIQTDEAPDGLDYLFELYSNPVSLNTASYDQLVSIPGMTSPLAMRIIDYRSRRQEFQSVSELLLFKDYSADILEEIRPFVTVKPPSQLQDIPIVIQIRSRLQRRVKKNRGLQEGKYSLSVWKSYQRITFERGEEIRGAFLIEKDPGESQWDDHRVGYVEVNGKNIRGIIGQYQLEFGQGLTFWRNYDVSKGNTAVVAAFKNSRGLRGYRSASENEFLQGGAVQIKTSSCEAIAFFSNKGVDGNFQDSGEVTSLYKSGYHRSPLEQSKKDWIKEVVYGGHITFLLPSQARVGITASIMKFDKKFISNKRDIFRFSGDSNDLISCDFLFPFRNGILFGEAVRSRGGGTGTVAGLRYSLERIDLMLHMRHYDRDFYSQYGNSFGERPYENRNEEGVYTGIRCHTEKWGLISFYADFYRFPWRTYYQPFPVNGREGMFRWDNSLGSRLKYYLLAKFSAEDATVSYDNVFGQPRSSLGEYYRNQVRFELKYNLRNSWQVTFRGYGGLVSCRVRLNPSKTSQIILSGTYFSSRKGATSFYLYESDLLGAFTIQQLRGKGAGGYIMIKLHLSSLLQFSVKYSYYYYPGLTHLGSGWDETQGNTRQNIGIQLDMTF